MALAATRDLCINGCAVPVEKATMSVVDPYGLYQGDTEDLAVSLVEFMASGNMVWLEKVIKARHHHLRPKWFKENSWRIPLLKEVLALIRAQKDKRGGEARAPRCRDYLIALKVRGKTLLFKNDSRYVCFADHTGGPKDPDRAKESLSDFNWFLNQLSKDVGDLQEIDSDERAQAKDRRRVDTADIQDLIDDSLKSLEDHGNCSSAKYFQSRNSFQVKRGHDDEQKLFRVEALKKKRKADADTEGNASVHRQFDLALARATAFLDNKAPGDLDGPEGPDDVEEDHETRSADSADHEA